MINTGICKGEFSCTHMVCSRTFSNYSISPDQLLALSFSVQAKHHQPQSGILDSSISLLVHTQSLILLSNSAFKIYSPVTMSPHLHHSPHPKPLPFLTWIQHSLLSGLPVLFLTLGNILFTIRSCHSISGLLIANKMESILLPGAYQSLLAWAPPNSVSYLTRSLGHTAFFLTQAFVLGVFPTWNAPPPPFQTPLRLALLHHLSSEIVWRDLILTISHHNL